MWCFFRLEVEIKYYKPLQTQTKLNHVTNSIWPNRYFDFTDLRWPTNVKCHNTNVLYFKHFHSLASLASLSSHTCFAFNRVLLNTTWKVKCLKEVIHLTKSVDHLTRCPSLESVLLKPRRNENNLKINFGC